MPDSVLAQVGKSRAITVSEFRHAWARLEPPSRPDSLTPKAAREFLDLLIDKEILGEQASLETWEWTALESAQYVGLRDRLTLKVVLDSVLSETRARLAAKGDSALDPTRLGIAARESTVAAMHPRFDEALVERLVRAWRDIPKPPRDSSIWVKLRAMGTMPAVDAADTGRVVVSSSHGDLYVGTVLDAWRRLNPIYRPRIESSEQMRDVIENALYERMLRQRAAARHLERRPDIAAELAKQHELADVTHLVQRDVYEKIPVDSLTLMAHYQAHKEVWILPRRLLLARFVLPDRASASQMAMRLRQEGQAETLIAQARRQGFDYSGEITAESDSLLFAVGVRGGVGAVVGPDSVERGWQVARVMEIREPRQRRYDEVRTLVHHDWYDLEGERRLVEFLKRLRKRTRVVVNEWAVAKLTGA
jgi:hypothetical protein